MSRPPRGASAKAARERTYDGAWLPSNHGRTNGRRGEPRSGSIAQREMFESVQRFVDLSMIDTVPTSRYVLS